MQFSLNMQFRRVVNPFPFYQSDSLFSVSLHRRTHENVPTVLGKCNNIVSLSVYAIVCLCNESVFGGVVACVDDESHLFLEIESGCAVAQCIN